MKLARVWEVARKDHFEVTRNRSLYFGLFFLPALIVLSALGQVYFVVQKAVASGGAVVSTVQDGTFLSLLFLLLIPASSSVVIGSMAIVLEKANRSLEPLLATPISDAELLWGKAVVPLTYGVGSSALAYAIVFAFGDALLAAHGQPPAFPGPVGAYFMGVIGSLLALIGTFASLWISIRAKDLRDAQQLSFLVALPSFGAVVAAFALLPVSIPTFAGVAAALAVVTYGMITRTIRRFDRPEILLKLG